MKFPKTFRVRKAICNTPTGLLCNMVFSYLVKGIKIEINSKVLCLETPSFCRCKENYVTRNAPEKFRDFRGTGLRSKANLVTWLYWAQLLFPKSVCHHYCDISCFLFFVFFVFVFFVFCFVYVGKIN